MNDLLVAMSKEREREFLEEAEQVKWLADARSKGYDVAGPVAWAIKSALSHLSSIR